MAASKARTTGTHPIYSVRGAALELGVTVQTIYRWMEDRTLQEAFICGSVQGRHVEAQSVLDLKAARMIGIAPAA